MIIFISDLTSLLFEVYHVTETFTPIATFYSHRCIKRLKQLFFSSSIWHKNISQLHVTELTHISLFIGMENQPWKESYLLLLT